MSDGQSNSQMSGVEVTETQSLDTDEEEVDEVFFYEVDYQQEVEAAGERLVTCYQCGSLFSEAGTEMCEEFRPRAPGSAAQCGPGEVCLLYQWQHGDGTQSAIRQGTSHFYHDMILIELNLILILISILMAMTLDGMV